MEASVQNYAKWYLRGATERANTVLYIRFGSQQRKPVKLQHHNGREEDCEMYLWPSDYDGLEEYLRQLLILQVPVELYVGTFEKVTLWRSAPENVDFGNIFRGSSFARRSPRLLAS